MATLSGNKVAHNSTDLRQKDKIPELIAEAEERLRGLDLLINNAGIADPRGFRSEHSDIDLYNDIVATDLNGLWYCCRASAQHFLRQGHGTVSYTHLTLPTNREV